MALTQCAECGERISDTAVMCPHCGAPPEVALAGASETVTREVIDDEGNAQTTQEQRPKAVCLRFVTHMVE